MSWALQAEKWLQERNEARAELAAVRAERNEARAELAAVRAELAAIRAELAAAPLCTCVAEHEAELPTEEP